MTRTATHARVAGRVAVGAALSLVCAGFGGVENLVSNSPFLPQAVAAQASGNGPLDHFELRGVASIGGVPTFSVYDTSSNRGYWIPLNGTEDGVRITSYDSKTEAVVLEGSGGSKRVTLKEVQIQTMPTQQVAATAGQLPQAIPLPAAPGINATEQEMAERRQRIIEELRRRRAIRQQAQAARQ